MGNPTQIDKYIKSQVKILLGEGDEREEPQNKIAITSYILDYTSCSSEVLSVSIPHTLYLCQ